MDGRRAIPMLAAALLAGAACDSMTERPGHDFDVHVLAESPVTVTGRIYVPVPFRVDGCEAFDVAVRDPSGTQHALPYASKTDGTLEIALPVAWMREPGPCREAATDVPVPKPVPVEAELVVTCRDAGRSARAGFSVLASTAAWSGKVSDYPVRAIFPGRDPFAPAFIAANEFGGEFALLPDVRSSSLWTTPDWATARDNPLVRPRMATAGSRGFVSLGCSSGMYCPPLSLGDETGSLVQTERIAELQLDGVGAAIAEAFVPRPVIDMAYAPDGALLVLSAAWDPWLGSGALVTRVEPRPDPGDGMAEDTVTVVAELLGESVHSRFSRTASGQLAFLTSSFSSYPVDEIISLHVIDGATVSTPLMLGGFAAPNPLFDTTIYAGWAQLSPDASTLLVSMPGDDPPWTYTVSTMSTDPADPALHPLSTYDSKSKGAPGGGGTVWMPGGLALWLGDTLWNPTQSLTIETGVYVYDDKPPHAVRSNYALEQLPGAAGHPVLVGATAVRDRLVLTTTTGVRIYDGDGHLVGGSDPLPCGATPTAAAEQVGQNTFGVGAGPLLFVFDVSGL